VAPSTRDEYNPNHHAQKKERDISELRQLRKYHRFNIRLLRTSHFAFRVSRFALVTGHWSLPTADSHFFSHQQIREVVV
jgi:hypothetical protein